MTGALRPAVFFDRDGVLNVDTDYTWRIEDFAWTPGAPEAVAEVNAAGWLAVVVTNQSGVARGFYDEAAVHAFHEHLSAELARFGARIDGFYACFHHAEAAEERWRHPDHPDRKPNPGMLLRAAADLGVDLARSAMIGDRQSDMEAARRAGVRGLLYTGGDLRETVRAALAAAPAAAPAG